MVNDDDVLAERLGEFLGRVEPGHAPVAAVISQGKAAKAKRRVAGGLAIAVVLAVSVPLAVHGMGSSVAPAGGPSVVVDPPHTDAKGALTFSGTVDGKAWSASPEQSGGMKGCLLSLGTCPDGFPTPTSPVDFSSSTGAGKYDPYVADFRSDVSSLDIILADGSRLTLLPAALGTHRVAVLMLPHGDRVDRATAHTTAGDQVSVPFHDPNGLNTFVAWYPPDAIPDQPETSGRVATGVAKDIGGKDQTWTVTAYVGAFGVCVEIQLNGSGGASCQSPQVRPSAALPFTKVKANGPSYSIATEVDPSVSRVDVTFLDGTKATLTPARVSGHAFVAIVVEPGEEIVRAVSVSLDGSVLADPDGSVPIKP